MYQPSFPAQSSSSAYFGAPGASKHMQMEDSSMVSSVLKTKRKRQSMDFDSSFGTKQSRVRSPPPPSANDPVPGLMRDESYSNSCSEEDMEFSNTHAHADAENEMMELDVENGTWRPRDEAIRDLGARQESPWSAQPFTTTLQPPPQRVGLMQPTMYTQEASLNATSAMGQIEAARRVHGPQCKTIPRLRLSDHPDPFTGQTSMWSHCADCGGCEKVTM